MSRRSFLRLGRSPGVDYDEVTERVRAGWEREGHEPLLRALEPVASVLVEVAGVQAGDRVLDAGAGDGNVAAAALALGADVEACDLAPAMVERGRLRVPGAAWQVADVQALPYPDGRFDAVLSAFGAALAPRAKRTARELVRVVRPGGVVALSAWVPRGLPGRLDEYLELPDGVPPPSDWGIQVVARRRLESLLERLEMRTLTVCLEFPDADACLAALLRPLGVEVDREELDRLLDDGEIGARYLVASGRRALY